MKYNGGLYNKHLELDPRHESLLDDHTPGFWWVRNARRYKYKGKLVFSSDFGLDLLRGYNKQVVYRRKRGRSMSFKTHGYVYGAVNFIKVLESDDPSTENYKTALSIVNKTISDERREAWEGRKQKYLASRYGPDYKGPARIIKQPGSRGPSWVWVWAFENKDLDLRFENIFSYTETFEDDDRVDELTHKLFNTDHTITTAMSEDAIDALWEKHKKAAKRQLKAEGSPVQRATITIGKSRRAFSEYYGLNYMSLRALASGRLKSYKGWTLIGKPTRLLRTKLKLRKMNQERIKNDNK